MFLNHCRILTNVIKGGEMPVESKTRKRKVTSRKKKFTFTVNFIAILRVFCMASVMAVSVYGGYQGAKLFSQLLNRVEENSKKLEHVLLNQRLITNKLYDMHNIVHRLNRKQTNKNACGIKDFNTMLEDLIKQLELQPMIEEAE